ncbi:MAG TPA: succinylglutamate desuccinylase/aspartoacylase family protein [Planctomycetota bacterium]|nr:succinylglutamate desuccinylase/aspartoacylase family protein [Planctomycetota bacterium]
MTQPSAARAIASASPASKRTIVPITGLDVETPGRRDYFVSFEHPTLWGAYLVPVTVFVGPECTPGQGLVAIGSTHGNECEGPVGIKRLLQDIAIGDVRGRIIMIPTLNVAAFAAGTRDTPEDGANLNRVFPGDPKGTITERFADFIQTRIFPHVHVVLDLHSATNAFDFALVASFHYVADKAQQRKMEETARGFGTRFVMVYQNDTPGLLTSTAERMGKITIGTELGWGCTVCPEGVSMGMQGVLTAAVQHGQLRGSVPANRHFRREEQILIDNSDHGCYVHATRAGLYEPRVNVGDLVQPDDLIGVLHDFDAIDAPGEEIRAPHRGYILCQVRARVMRGQVLSVVSVPKPWME